MLLIILSFHVLLVWHSQEVSAGEITVNPSGCGRVPTNHSTVNGLLPDDDRLPWMVILAVEYTRYSVTCTGSILTRLHVLTVSHCTYMNGNVPISIQASYGSPIQYQGYMVSVEKVLRHPGFVQQTYANDISLLKVDKPFVLSELVNPICVSLSPVDVLRKRVRVAGWGHLEHRGLRRASGGSCRRRPLPGGGARVVRHWMHKQKHSWSLHPPRRLRHVVNRERCQ